MPPGRVSPFNEAQKAIITGYIQGFEARVREVDPELNGNNSRVTQWKSATTEEILKRPEFQGLGDLKKWREVSTSSRMHHIIPAN
jgi:hypothetical protein